MVATSAATSTWMVSRGTTAVAESTSIVGGRAHTCMVWGRKQGEAARRSGGYRGTAGTLFGMVPARMIQSAWSSHLTLVSGVAESMQKPASPQQGSASLQVSPTALHSPGGPPPHTGMTTGLPGTHLRRVGEAGAQSQDGGAWHGPTHGAVQHKPALPAALPAPLCSSFPPLPLTHSVLPAAFSHWPCTGQAGEQAWGQP